MSIAVMKKLQMIVPRGQTRQLIRSLAKAGCLEIERCDDWMNDPELSGLLFRSSAGNENARMLSELNSAMDNLKKYAGIKRGLFTPPVPETEEGLATQAPDTDVTAAAQRINADAKELAAIHSDKSRIAALLETLQPWLSCDVPLNCRGGKKYEVIFATAPAVFPFEDIRLAAEQSGAAAELELVSSGKELHYMIITVYSEHKQELLSKLKEFGISETGFTGLTETADAERLKAEAQLKEYEERSEALAADIAELGKNFDELGRALDYYSNQAAWDELSSSLPCTKRVALLTGWCPEKALDTVTAIAEECGCAYEISDPGDGEEPPTYLVNNSLVSAFGTVTSLYGMPLYRSIIDPNPVVALSYFIFFGMMFSDAAYGLILFFGCLFFLKKARPQGGMKRFMTMFMLCGVSTFLWGVIFGSWFGDFVTVVTERLTGTAWSMPALLDPLEEPIVMLILSLVLGVIHLYTGMILNIIRQAKRGEWVDIICDELSWMIAIPCLALSLLGFTPGLYIAAAMIVLIALTGGRGKKGLGRFTGGFSAVYNGATGNLSDILSYSRLMALAMSTGVIAQVMNTLGNMLGTSLFGWLFFIVVFCVGQVFNFAISILGAFVHSCRLQFVELFGRFYEGGGHEFAPFGYKLKYVEIKEDLK